jgi:DNA-binding transcriptional MerR regulator/effector-binding domain-containing protein
MNVSYQIGEFSRITGLSVKTLRFYHEKGILVPNSVDDATGYRFYDESKIDKARVIMRLRAMEFSIEDIATVLGESPDEADILDSLERQRDVLRRRVESDRAIVRSLDEIIATEKGAKELLERGSFSVEEKVLEPMLVAGIRMRGKYIDCGDGFAKLGKAVGRHISGKAICLYFDGEFRETDAEFEPCFPIRKGVEADGVSVRTLQGGRCLALAHRGAYDSLGRAYGKLLARVAERQLRIFLPTREIYLKGPGMIFKGNPRNYLTEIQLPIAG